MSVFDNVRDSSVSASTANAAAVHPQTTQTPFSTMMTETAVCRHQAVNGECRRRAFVDHSADADTVHWVSMVGVCTVAASAERTADTPLSLSVAAAFALTA